MRKKQPLLFNNPPVDPSFEALQKHWYEVLKNEGFEEQEDTTYTDRPLKRWTGVASFYVDQYQPAGKSLVSSFPQSNVATQERFIHHRDFDQICQKVCEHGNRKVTPETVASIWKDYCAGMTFRDSNIKHKTSFATVFRVIRKVTEWMSLMDSQEQKTPAEPDKTVHIILRDFRPETDNPMIYSTWRNAIWYGEKRDEREANAFYSLATRLIKALLKRPDIQVKIACDRENPNHIVGYSVMRGTHLEFVYVKIDYRRGQIAKLLTKGFKTITEPQTRIGKKLAELFHLEVKENERETVQ